VRYLAAAVFYPMMVVISTHGMSGWRPMIFGSIAEKIVRLVQCPLLLLRSVEAVSPPPRNLLSTSITTRLRLSHQTEGAN
jgi:hypothetical protein